MPLKTTLAPSGAQSLQALRVETKDGLASPSPPIEGVFIADMFVVPFMVVCFNPNPFIRGYNLRIALPKFPLLLKEGQGWLFQRHALQTRASIYFVNCHTGLMAVA